MQWVAVWTRDSSLHSPKLSIFSVWLMVIQRKRAEENVSVESIYNRHTCSLKARFAGIQRRKEKHFLEEFRLAPGDYFGMLSKNCNNCSIGNFVSREHLRNLILWMALIPQTSLHRNSLLIQICPFQCKRETQELCSFIWWMSSLNVIITSSSLEQHHHIISLSFEILQRAKCILKQTWNIWDDNKTLNNEMCIREHMRIRCSFKARFAGIQRREQKHSFGGISMDS